MKIRFLIESETTGIITKKPRVSLIKMLREEVLDNLVHWIRDGWLRLNRREREVGWVARTVSRCDSPL